MDLIFSIYILTYTNLLISMQLQYRIHFPESEIIAYLFILREKLTTQSDHSLRNMEAYMSVSIMFIIDCPIAILDQNTFHPILEKKSKTIQIKQVALIGT